MPPRLNRSKVFWVKMKANYTRLYADDEGESHFEDLEAELAAVDFAPPAPPLNLSSFLPATQMAFFGAPADWRGDWHPSAARNMFKFRASGKLRRATVTCDDSGHTACCLSRTLWAKATSRTSSVPLNPRRLLSSWKIDEIVTGLARLRLSRVKIPASRVVEASMRSSSPEKPAASPDPFKLGRRGEELAAAYLQQAGYQIVASNFTIPVGRNRNDAVVSVEIDLVAYDDPTLCFVEVKTRTSDWFAAPTANVDLKKQRQIMRASRAYRRMFGLTRAPYRYDVLSIVWPAAEEGSNVPRLALLRNFWSEEKFRQRSLPERYWD